MRAAVNSRTNTQHFTGVSGIEDDQQTLLIDGETPKLSNSVIVGANASAATPRHKALHLTQQHGSVSGQPVEHATPH